MIRYLIAALIGCLILIYGGWQHIQAQGVALATATERNATLEAAAESRRKTQRLLADLDTQHTQELANAQATNAQLRADVAAGALRLSVLARCPAVRAATGPASMDDAGTRAELDPTAAERIVATATDGDAAIIALTGLQDYVTRVCQGGTTQKGR